MVMRNFFTRSQRGIHIRQQAKCRYTGMPLAQVRTQAAKAGYQAEQDSSTTAVRRPSRKRATVDDRADGAGDGLGGISMEQACARADVRHPDWDPEEEEESVAEPQAEVLDYDLLIRGNGDVCTYQAYQERLRWGESDVVARDRGRAESMGMGRGRADSMSSVMSRDVWGNAP